MTNITSTLTPAVANSPATTLSDITIIGAGLAGSLLAIYLARQGYHVTVYERRADPHAAHSERRSINLGLSARGIQALHEVGLLEQVMEGAVAMKGRVIHSRDGQTVFQPYGNDAHEVLHSIDRTDLGRLLITTAEATGRVTFVFQTRFLGLDKSKRTITLLDECTGEQRELQVERLIGADGAFSAVRQQIQKGEPADYQQEFLPWGYKELTLPTAPHGGSRIELEAFHVWSRDNALIVSHPNLCGSHTLTLFLPLKDAEDSFERLTTPEAVDSFFMRHFPDLVTIMPDIVAEYQSHPVGKLVTTRTAPWHYEDWVLLIGDACHAVYPFYGQGMNSALEDCATLNRCLPSDGTAPEWGSLFHHFQTLRKPHTDVLAELSKQNFYELSSKVQSPLFLLRKRLDIFLNRLFPSVWKPLYTMISHTTMPYADALAQAQRQDRLLRWASIGALGTLVVAALRRVR